MPTPAPITTGPIAVTGATGFVGRAIVRELLARTYAVRALVRDPRKARDVLPIAADLALVVGNVLDPGKPTDLVRGCTACIHLIGILREAPGGQTFRRMHIDATRSMVEACESAGVRRFVHMSALGVCDRGICEYQRSKWQSERLVAESALDWTIFRPGMIHGPGSEFLDMVKGFSSGLEPPFVFLPYFVSGREDKRVPMGPVNSADPRVAPVHVEDVARAFVRAIATPATIGETYNLTGPESFTWPQLLRLIRDGTGGSRYLQPFGIPARVASAAAVCAKRVGAGALLPFDEGMPLMAAQDATCDNAKAAAHLKFEPRPFRETFAEYAESL